MRLPWDRRERKAKRWEISALRLRKRGGDDDQDWILTKNLNS